MKSCLVERAKDSSRVRVRKERLISFYCELESLKTSAFHLSVYMHVV